MFTCKFADKIQEFLDQKRNGGAVYTDGGYILQSFNCYAAQNFPDCSTITREMFEGWLASMPHIHPNTVNRRVPVIRQLSNYLAGYFPATYIIPARITSPEIHYQVHLITKKELAAFFEGAARFCTEPSNHLRKHQQLEIPVIFRMLYATGMRSGEVLNLKREDVNLETGKVVIRESKGHKMRVIFMHPELTALCRDYDERIDRLYPDREPFFCNKNGVFLGEGSIWRWFHKIWDELPEAQEQKGNPFTPHSFRHNFALTVLNRWYREGKDLNVMLPYLAEYMGHTSLEALNYYLHLNEEFRPEIGKALKDTNDFILPEVCDGSSK